jgi:hypothetical protein
LKSELKFKTENRIKGKRIKQKKEEFTWPRPMEPARQLGPGAGPA